jgi:hypothetical protein
VTVEDPAQTQLVHRVLQARRDHNMPAAAAAYRELLARFSSARLPTDALLDVANQLMLEKDFRPAAHAYEVVIRSGGSGSNTDDVKQILSLIYGRYLGNPKRALELLSSIIEHVHDPQRRAFLLEEIAALRVDNAAAPGDGPGTD